MTPLTKIGKRLDNITRYILDTNPQDKWVLSNIVPMFLEVIKSSTTIKTTYSLNRLKKSSIIESGRIVRKQTAVLDIFQI
jgi:hypothetical protein